MRARPALLLATLLAPVAAAGGDWLSASATLHLRATLLEDLPASAVRFDPGADAFALDGYLVPRGEDLHASAFASFGLRGDHLGGDLRWVLQVDTGELRRRRFHRIEGVCVSDAGPTGLALASSGRCRPGAATYQVETTSLGGAQLSSNGRPLREEVRKTLLVREAYAAWSFGRAGFATVRAGRKRLSVGDGHVYDDYATGVELSLDLGAIGPSWSATLAAVQPTRDLPSRAGEISPLFAARIDWLPSLFEHVGAFAALSRERAGSTGEILRGALTERLVLALGAAAPGSAAYRTRARDLARTLAERLDDDAVLAWLGTSGSLVPARGQRLAWTAAVLGGSIRKITTRDVGGEPLLLAQDVALRGQLASLRWETDLGPRASAGAFVLYLSGGTLPDYGAGEPVRGTYRGFLGVAPYETATNLFFGGGLSESFAARQVSAPGVNGRGVVAPGVSFAADPVDAVSLEARAAWLAAPAAGPFGGKVYGTEVDLELTWSARDWLLVGAEVDALFPGNFFPGRRTMLKSILALDVLFP